MRMYCIQNSLTVLVKEYIDLTVFENSGSKAEYTPTL